MNAGHNLRTYASLMYGAGGDILQQFADYLKEPEKEPMKHERMCLDFSNKWWSLLHTTRPFIMTDLMQLADTARHLILNQICAHCKHAKKKKSNGKSHRVYFMLEYFS